MNISQLILAIVLIPGLKTSSKGVKGKRGKITNSTEKRGENIEESKTNDSILLDLDGKPIDEVFGTFNGEIGLRDSLNGFLPVDLPDLPSLYKGVQNLIKGVYTPSPPREKDGQLPEIDATPQPDLLSFLFDGVMKLISEFNSPLSTTTPQNKQESHPTGSSSPAVSTDSILSSAEVSDHLTTTAQADFLGSVLDSLRKMFVDPSPGVSIGGASSTPSLQTSFFNFTNVQIPVTNKSSQAFNESGVHCSKNRGKGRTENVSGHQSFSLLETCRWAVREIPSPGRKDVPRLALAEELRKLSFIKNVEGLLPGEKRLGGEEKEVRRRGLSRAWASLKNDSSNSNLTQEVLEDFKEFFWDGDGNRSKEEVEGFKREGLEDLIKSGLRNEIASFLNRSSPSSSPSCEVSWVRVQLPLIAGTSTTDRSEHPSHLSLLSSKMGKPLEVLPSLFLNSIRNLLKPWI